MTSSTLRHRLERDVPDARDFIYAPDPERLGKKLPPTVDLRPKCPPVLDQGNTYSCTAHAVSAAFAYEQRMQKKRPIKPSPRFIYYNEMEMTGQLGKHSNSVHLRDAIKAVATRGVCPESLWRFRDDEDLMKKKPHPMAFHAAQKRKLVVYWAIRMDPKKPQLFLDHLKHCLAEGYPFVFGFTVHKSFEHKHGKWKGGIMPMPNLKTGESHGGHAVMAVGYDDRKQVFLVRNSWGSTWGDKGHFRMPYKLITNPKFAHSFWTIRGVTG